MSKYEALAPRRDKPLLILGISGVVILDDGAAVPTSSHRVSAWGRWVREVQIPDDAARRIRELSASFEIVWASEWGHNAHTALRDALGLPEEPWPFLPVQFGKIDMITHYTAGWPWVWVDEEIVDVAGPAPVDDTGVVVRVDPRLGICAVDAEQLLAALAALPAGSARDELPTAPGTVTENEESNHV